MSLKPRVMARLLATLHAQSATGNSVAAFGGFLMGLCATVMVVSVCVGFSRRKRIRDKMSTDGENSPTSRAGAIAAAKGQKLQDTLELQAADQIAPDVGQRTPVWQRTILKGERCKPPTFSGLILYDEKGNPLPMKTHTVAV